MTTTAISAQGATLVLGTVIAQKTITAISKANPAVATITAHGLTAGSLMKVASVTGMIEINGMIGCVGVKDANNVYLYGIDSTSFTTYTSGGTLTGAEWAVGNWKSYSGFNGQRTELDATSLSSTAMEFLPGLADNGTVDIAFFMDDADDGQKALRANLGAPSINSTFKITFANSKTRTWSGFVKSMPEQGGVNALLDATASIRVSGPVTRGG